VARKRIAVLISGRGSNLQSLLDAAADDGYPGEIVIVVSNRADALGLERARRAGVCALVIDHRRFGKAEDGRRAFENALTRALEDARADLVCLAGFMRILSPDFVARWSGRLVNIHPSLLPAFKGLDAHARMIAAGVKIAGCTVHFVSTEMDAGPIIGQAATPVLPGDDAEKLAARILAEEHKLYPACVRLVCDGRARLAATGIVEFDPSVAAGAPLRNPY
jgi:phosphoribosylglycinamide formyltransferase-1